MTSPLNNLKVALALAEAGLPIFPAKVSFNETKQKWIKEPRIKGWQQEATTNAQTLREWWRAWPDAVPGIELGRAGLVIIDTDRHGTGDGVAAFAALVAQHVPLANHPIAKTAGGGEHHYFKQWRGETFGNSEGALHGKDINIRGKGGFIVAPGSVRPDGKRWQPAGLATAYRNNTIPILPDWIAAMIRPAYKADAQTKQSNEQRHDRPPWSEAEDARVQDALKLIPSDARETWLRIGAALHWTGWPTARTTWDAWSQTTPGAFDADDQEKTWDSFDRGHVGKPFPPRRRKRVDANCPIGTGQAANRSRCRLYISRRRARQSTTRADKEITPRIRGCRNRWPTQRRQDLHRNSQGGVLGEASAVFRSQDCRAGGDSFRRRRGARTHSQSLRRRIDEARNHRQTANCVDQPITRLQFGRGYQEIRSAIESNR